jgi:hypothetical protein
MTNSKELRDACDWLRDLLRSGPIYQRDVVRLAREDRISWSRVEVAKRELGVNSINVNSRNKHAVWKLWFWELPRPRAGLLFDQDDRG